MESFKLDNLHIRPRFELTVPFSASVILEDLKQRLKHADAPCDGYVAQQHVVLRVPYEEQHFWSPQMQFSIEDLESGSEKCEIRGLVGPQPAVWTLFVFIYSAIGVIGTFASLYGLSKWSLGEYSAFIWATPVTILLLGTAYLASKFGQRLGHDQIATLSRFMEKVINQQYEKMN